MNNKFSWQVLAKSASAAKYGSGLLLCASLLSFAAFTAVSRVKAEDVAPASAAVAETPASPAPQASPEAENPAVAEPQAVPANQVESATAASELPASQVMSDEQKQRAIAQMGANQGDVWVWSEENVVEENGERQKRGPNGGPGQFNGGAVVLGGRPTYDPAADWYYLAYKGEGMTDEEAKAVFDKERGKWMNEFDPWGVVMEMTDNKASNAWADIRNMQAFVLRKDSNVWEKIVDHPQGVQWVSQFKGNMSSYVGDARQEALAGGGTAIEVLPKQDRVAHWGSDQARDIPNPQTIRAVLVSVEARISEKSDPDAKLGIQVGGDWKFAEEVSKPLWYPGAGLAGIQRLTKDWARYYFVSLTGIQDAVEERAISQDVFMKSIVPLADMEQVAQNQAQQQTPASPDPKSSQAENLTYKTSGQTDPQEASQESTLQQASSKQLPKTGSQSSLLTNLLGLGILVLQARGKIIYKKATADSSCCFVFGLGFARQAVQG